MTYCETKGRKSFDWNKALNIPFEEFDLSMLTKLVIKSQDWVTCACGNQCDIIPRFDTGAPADSLLGELGIEFNRNILSAEIGYRKRMAYWVNRIESAQEILKRIELRSAELIAKIRARNE